MSKILKFPKLNGPASKAKFKELAELMHTMNEKDEEYDKKFKRVQKFNNVNKNYLIFFINKFLNSSTATVAGL